MKILHILPGIDGGGVGAVVYNYYSKIDRNNIHFDLAIIKPQPENKELMYDSFIKLGSSIFYIGNRKGIKGKCYLVRLLKENSYDAIHVHDDEWSVLYCILGKIAGIHIRISHAHLARVERDPIKRIAENFLRTLIPEFVTHKFACGIDAALSMYKTADNVYILNNAIDVYKYKYSEKLRNRVRNALKIKPETFVVGHVGRFSYQKNHDFLVNIFNEIVKKKKDSVLLLVGDGELKKEIERKVINLGIANKVIFVGNTLIVNEYLQAMDVFVFPSRYEGLSVAAIEAQASNLPVFASNLISYYSKISDNFWFIYDTDPQKWANYIINTKKNLRKTMLEEIRNNGFDLAYESQKLEKFYLSLI